MFPGGLYRIEGSAGERASGGPPPRRGPTALLCWPEGFDFVMDYHTMINSSTLLMYSHCLKGLKNVKCGLIAGEAGGDEA